MVAHTPLEQGLLTGRYVEEGGDAKGAKACSPSRRAPLARNERSFVCVNVMATTGAFGQQNGMKPSMEPPKLVCSA